MSEFGTKVSITDDDFMIHVLGNLYEEYNIILDGLVHHLTLTGPDAMTIEVNCDKLNQWFEKLKTKEKK